MFAAASSQSQPSSKQHKKKGPLSLSGSFRPENLFPGLVIGFLLGFFLDLSGPLKKPNVRRRNLLPGKRREQCVVSGGGDVLELKMVLVVRQDLKMGQGKVASQCAHAATGMYAELMQRIKLMEAAENLGLPTFVVADAGRTQVAAGSRTVLAIGPGPKELVDSVTGRLRLL